LLLREEGRKGTLGSTGTVLLLPKAKEAGVASSGEEETESWYGTPSKARKQTAVKLVL